MAVSVSAAGPDTGPRRLLACAIAVLAAATAVGVVGAVNTAPEVARAGDLRVAARDFAFQPAVLEAEAGGIVVFVDNADPTLHDLTIDEVVSQDVSGWHARRVAFALPPGDYTFRCTLHPSMTGTLVVR